MLLEKSILLSCFLVALGSFPQQGVEQRVKGCWSVQLGEWKPEMPYGADTIFVTPPAKIELQDKYYYGQVGTRWSVLPSNEAKPSIHSVAFFQPIGTDSIAIIWSTGFSGLSLHLAIGQDTLKGIAITFWDFDRPQQTADAILVRMKCH